MKERSHKFYRPAVLVLSSLLPLGVLLLINNSTPLAANRVAQAGWRVELEEGKTTHSTLTINNRCPEPHIFRVKHNVKYLHFDQPTNSILIEPSSGKDLGVRFDAKGLKSKVYRDKVVVECLDCKKARGCHQDRDELLVEMTVTKSSPAGDVPSNYKAISVKIGKPDQKKGTIRISSLMPSTPTRLVGTDSVVKARARVSGGSLIIEFTGRLPNNSEKLMVVSNLPLADIGAESCMVEAGLYDISYSQAGMQSAKLSLAPSAIAMTAKHKRKYSKKIG